MEEQGFDAWALVELMGHQRIAGKVTEAQIGGSKFVRVDVPGSDGVQPLTKYLGQSSIYAITPVTEETATKLAANLKVAPVNQYDARMLFAATKPLERRLHEPDDDFDEDDDRNHEPL